MRAVALSRWLRAVLGCAAVLAVADAVIRLQRAAAIGALLHAPSSHARAALAAADRRVIAISRAGVAWWLISGIVFLVWLGLAYRDLVRGGARHQLSIGLALAAPFIPVATLVLFPRAMDDLSRQSRFPRTSRVAWWFGLYLLTGASRYAGIALRGEGRLVDFQRTDRAFAGSDVLEIATAVLLIGLIAVISTRATARMREAADVQPAVDPASVGGALGWYRDPRRQAEVRWWDGLAWTEQVADSRDAPPPIHRVEPESAPATDSMPVSAKLCLFAGILAILVLPAPAVLALGLWALRSVRRRFGAAGRGRAWFAVISGGFFSALLVLAVALG